MALESWVLRRSLKYLSPILTFIKAIEVYQYADWAQFESVDIFCEEIAFEKIVIIF